MVPPHFNALEPMNDDLTSDVARVRLVLSRELETISLYESLAAKSEGDEARAFFSHLAREEKEHVAEATALLQRMDPDQATFFAREYPATHFAATPATTEEPKEPNEPKVELPERVPEVAHRVLYALPAPPNAAAGKLTVGSLRRKS